MYNLFYPKKFHETLTALEKFEKISLNFIIDNFQEVSPHFTNDLLIDLLSSISSLSHQVKEYSLTNDSGQQSIKGALIEYTLRDVCKDFQYLGLVMEDEYSKTHFSIAEVWLAYNDAYQNLVKLMTFHTFSFEIADDDSKISE